MNRINCQYHNACFNKDVVEINVLYVNSSSLSVRISGHLKHALLTSPPASVTIKSR